MTPPLSSSLDNPFSSPRPTLARGVVFRLAFAYWTIFCLPILATQIKGLSWVARGPISIWNAMVVWVGQHVLAIPYEINALENGSGDKTFNWVSVFCVASIALIVTVVWSMVDRRRAHDARLRELLRVIVRYTLAFVILGYGVTKLFLGQFPAPTSARLLQRFGDASPMGLLWTFMGASPAYVVFAGAGETLGAVLLLFRRTTTLGALLLASVLTNIVMLNFCYDVPVKINSAHYLAMSIFLILPDLGRLANVVVFNRVAQPVARELILPRRSLRVGRLVLKYAAIAVVLFTTISWVHSTWSQTPEREAWYGGYWNVATLVRDGREVPPLITDVTRWKLIRFQVSGDEVYVRWRFMDDSLGDLYTAVVDEQAGTMSLTPDERLPAKHPTGPVVLAYVRVDGDHVKLEGKVGAQVLSVQLQRFDIGNMLLVSRGFHWINEESFSR